MSLQLMISIGLCCSLLLRLLPQPRGEAYDEIGKRDHQHNRNPIRGGPTHDCCFCHAMNSLRGSLSYGKAKDNG